MAPHIRVEWRLRTLMPPIFAVVGLLSHAAAGEQSSTTRLIASIVEKGIPSATTIVTDQHAGATFVWEGAAQDWSLANSVAVTVENPSASPVRVTLRVEDGKGQGLEGSVVVPASRQATLLLPFYLRTAGIFAMPPATKAADELIPRDVHGSVDTGLVNAFRVQAPDEAHRIRTGSPVLVRDDWRQRLSGISDEFGQYVGALWPEKVSDDPSLRSHLAAATATIERLENASPRLQQPFGSLPAPNDLRPSGFFRAEQKDGRWWLVTPDGHGFFSLGVNTVRAASQTRVKDRAFMFTALPRAGTPGAQFLDPSAQAPDAWDVEGTNIERGLGPAWRDAWPPQTVRRLKAWGFNTIGDWSDTAVTGLGQMPYVTTLHIGSNAGDIAVDDRQSIPDPFDPAFEPAAELAAQAASAGLRDDPMLIGYFGANELPWRGIGRSVLARPGPSAARTKLIERLRAKYVEVGPLGAAWGLTNLTSWDRLNLPIILPNPPTGRAEADLSNFEAAFADRWFQVVSEAIRHYDPNHLFLGARFAAWTPEAVRACARWCDVLSFNIYARSPSPSAATALWRVLDKPVLISEFHFGSADRGSFWPGVVDVDVDEKRAPAYAAYLKAATDDPDIVGCHWFAYSDEPLTGRIEDGENGHIGLVAITDVPWAEFTKSVSSANRDGVGYLLRR